MCGIFGRIVANRLSNEDIDTISKHSEQRGMDSSGLVRFFNDQYLVDRADYRIEKLMAKIKPYDSEFIFGHSRLITNGLEDNQPVVKEDIILVHNGIVVNDDDLWEKLKVQRNQKIDSEVIAGIALDYLAEGHPVDSSLSSRIISLCKGVVACALLIPKHGKLILFSNNGSLYIGENSNGSYFASEKYALELISCKNIKQVKEGVVFDVPASQTAFAVSDFRSRNENLIPSLQFNKTEEDLLTYKKFTLRRCTRCILPETMPHIQFDTFGICNFCRNYKMRNRPKPKEQLFNLVEKYRKAGTELDCIVPFSGGRDSCYALHLITNELKMKPVTYTYDWGMVTDLGRRNISRMCSQLGVENIVVADDISKKRKNIAMNLSAWLKAPNLGMISILTAGDKHFFKYVESIKKQTGINLNLWGVNPLEVTHFKAGFLGVKPDFEEKMVYANGFRKQLNYHSKRFRAMLESPGYFNRSLWDTLSGEYYRSFTKKDDYFHVFDYWKWDENIIEDTLFNTYDWERAIDTKTTWRIGDGTAGFYNYVYYTVAGFTEHDTFRSNQIREGEISREEALRLIEEENQPRYPNIRWYLDALNMDFKEVIKVVNGIPRLWE
ncbi:MAG: glucosamine 6-phosphate synthetase [Bacteriovoracia bacterium]